MIENYYFNVYLKYEVINTSFQIDEIVNKQTTYK